MTNRSIGEPADPVAQREAAGKTDARGGKPAVLTEEQLAAIKVYNEYVEKYGVFSDGLRSF